MSITDHPLRLAAAGELHARPFPPVEGPCMAVVLALMPDSAPAARNRTRDLFGLRALLTHYGAPLPDEAATHYFGEVGRAQLKWECHTEFVTYTVFLPLEDGPEFDPRYFDFFPADWLSHVQGDRLTSALIRVDAETDPEAIVRKANDWFVRDSLAMSRVVDGIGTLAGDFRIDPAGHIRFALFMKPGMGSRRTGRIVQRIAELEVYKAAAMLGLLETSDLGARLAGLEEELNAAVGSIRDDRRAEGALDRLLTISSDLEETATGLSFRFGATEAYAQIVGERIEVLREERITGRQTFGEFMIRRFRPAMRTVAARQARLTELSARAARAAELLRTKVDVARSAQNQQLLASMDKRADLQLRLQKTVEGLSVVAISYYAVNLVAALLAPVVTQVSKTTLTGALVLPVVLFVWLTVRRIRKKLGH